MVGLPIPLDSLIGLESHRLELKASWNNVELNSAVRTICAFANDFWEANGGYLIFGIAQDEATGTPILPPMGLDHENLDAIQKKLFEVCKLIQPDYIPQSFVENYQNKTILVIWCPPGDLRPYQVPENAAEKSKGTSYYYIRQANVTSRATGQTLTQLMQKANRTPFDDRPAIHVTLDVLSFSQVRNFLADIGSSLLSDDALSPEQVYRQLRLTKKINGHEVPLNMALLLFTDDPEQFFPGARIEVVEFDDEGDRLKTNIFRGPLHKQIRQALDFLVSFSSTTIHKVAGQAQANSMVTFPYEAMRESLVNAVYHRSYEGEQNPVLVRLYPDKMEIISYPGPLPGINQADFRPGAALVPQHRNRRIGEFLRQLHLAEMYATGIPKIFRRMKENGSPEPSFTFDNDRSYFRVTLPAHPQSVVQNTLRKSASLWATGERQRAIRQLENTHQAFPESGAVLAQLIEYYAASDEVNFAIAEKLFSDNAKNLQVADRHLLYMTIANAYLDRKNTRRAGEILRDAPISPMSETQIELAILFKRAGQLEEAHRIFEASYDLIKNDAKAMHEFATTKTLLAGKTRYQTSRQQFNKEAEHLLRRAIQLADNDIRRAWSYFHLAQVLCWLKAPETEILAACAKAMELHSEPAFGQWFNRYQQDHQCK